MANDQAAQQAIARALEKQAAEALAKHVEREQWAKNHDKK